MSGTRSCAASHWYVSVSSSRPATSLAMRLQMSLFLTWDTLSREPLENSSLGKASRSFLCPSSASGRPEMLVPASMRREMCSRKDADVGTLDDVEQFGVMMADQWMSLMRTAARSQADMASDGENKGWEWGAPPSPSPPGPPVSALRVLAGQA